MISGGIPERSNGADCKSVVTDFGGSNPPSPTSSEIPLAAALPARRAESFAGRGISSLSPANRVAGFAGDFFTGDEGRGIFVGPGRLVRPFLFRVSGSYKKLGGKLKIAHMFDYVKGEFTRFL